MEKVYGDLFQMLTVRILEIHDTPIKDISDNTFNGVIANGLKVSQDKAYDFLFEARVEIIYEQISLMSFFT